MVSFVYIKENCTFAPNVQLVKIGIFMPNDGGCMANNDKNMGEDIKNALKTLKDGGVILYPTDTIWGLGCDACNAEAVAKVFAIKKRSDSKSLLALTDSTARIEGYVGDVPEAAWELAELAETPLTIIYPGARNLAPNMIAEDGSVGIRVTKEKFSMELCKAFRRPIVSTSANISGTPAPQCFDEIPEEIKAQADYIVEYRRNEREKKSASSIIKFERDGSFSIIR